MGLVFLTKGIPYEEDFSYGERASWSYAGFNDFRRRLAREVVEVELEEIWADPVRFQFHPLFSLLNHSDCDGELSPKECNRLGPALMLAVNGWPRDDYDRRMAIKLIHHMSYCVETGRALEFR